jgi:hypothetical protein
MRLLSLMIAIIACVFATVAAAAERAGVIEAFLLKDQDAVRGSAIARAGQDMKPAVMMPLLDGDVIYLDSPASWMRAVLLDGSAQEVRGPVRRKIEASAAGGDTWDAVWWAWDAIAGNEADESPTNLAAKGLGPVVKAAPTGGTILRGSEPVYLAWSGGTAPYIVSVGDKVYESPAAGIEFSIPANASKHLRVEIKDAKGVSTRISLRLTDQTPTPPAELVSHVASKDFRMTIAAAWLAHQEQGRWRIEAMRRLYRLKSYEPAQHLLAALANGDIK